MVGYEDFNFSNKNAHRKESPANLLAHETALAYAVQLHEMQAFYVILCICADVRACMHDIFTKKRERSPKNTPFDNGDAARNDGNLCIINRIHKIYLFLYYIVNIATWIAVMTASRVQMTANFVCAQHRLPSFHALREVYAVG